jgi:AAA family ATP:ADP antiporter
MTNTRALDTNGEPSRVGVLAPVVDVRKGEVLPLFASMLWIFLALTAYYIIKPLRSAVLQEKIGVDNKSIALVATTAFVAIFAWAYGKVVPVVARSKLIVATFVVFVACLGAFAVALPVGGALTGYVFYVWVSTFNLMIVSQFWSLAADVWTKEEGVRLFGFIGVGGVAGGIVGTAVVSGFAKTLTTTEMLLLSAGVLSCCLLLALYILRFGARRAPKATEDAAPSAEVSRDAAREGSVAHVLSSPYLRLVAAMMLVLNIVNTNNEWILDKMVSRESMSSPMLKEFYAQYFLLQNAVTFGIQFFLTSRVQKRFGARGALFVEPVIGILGGLAFLAAPVLRVIRVHKILENASDYSIQSNTKELLYLPVSKIEKYAAKTFNDTFVVRGGDALAAGVIFAATSVVLPALGAVGLRVMIGIDIALGVVWLVIASAIGKMHRERMATMSPAETETP